MVTAGVLSHQGVMRWWLALATCMVGVMSGDIVLYWVGRRYGGRVLERGSFGGFSTRHGWRRSRRRIGGGGLSSCSWRAT